MRSRLEFLINVWSIRWACNSVPIHRFLGGSGYAFGSIPDTRCPVRSAAGGCDTLPPALTLAGSIESATSGILKDEKLPSRRAGLHASIRSVAESGSFLIFAHSRLARAGGRDFQYFRSRDKPAPTLGISNRTPATDVGVYPAIFTLLSCLSIHSAGSWQAAILCRSSISSIFDYDYDARLKIDGVSKLPL